MDPTIGRPRHSKAGACPNIGAWEWSYSEIAELPIYAKFRHLAISPQRQPLAAASAWLGGHPESARPPGAVAQPRITTSQSRSKKARRKKCANAARHEPGTDNLPCAKRAEPVQAHPLCRSQPAAGGRRNGEWPLPPIAADKQGRAKPSLFPLRPSSARRPFKLLTQMAKPAIFHSEPGDATTAACLPKRAPARWRTMRLVDRRLNAAALRIFFQHTATGGNVSASPKRNRSLSADVRSHDRPARPRNLPLKITR